MTQMKLDLCALSDSDLDTAYGTCRALNDRSGRFATFLAVLDMEKQRRLDGRPTYKYVAVLEHRFGESGATAGLELRVAMAYVQEQRDNTALSDALRAFWSEILCALLDQRDARRVEAADLERLWRAPAIGVPDAERLS